MEYCQFPGGVISTPVGVARGQNAVGIVAIVFFFSICFFDVLFSFRLINLHISNMNIAQANAFGSGRGRRK